MVNITVVDEILAGLEDLEFYPSDHTKRLRILGEVCEMAHDDEQVRWLVRRMTSGIYEKWINRRELRACFCSRYKPRDGKDTTSVVYPEGFPPDPEVPQRKPQQIETTARAALPPAEQAIDNAHEIERVLAAHPPLAPVRRTKLLPGENELQALKRAFEEDRARPERKPRLPTDDEIAAIKRRQAENATAEETRRILAGEKEKEPV